MTPAPASTTSPSTDDRQAAVDRLRETIRTRPGVSEAERSELFADVDLLAGPPAAHCTVHEQYTHGCTYCGTALFDLARATRQHSMSGASS